MLIAAANRRSLGGRLCPMSPPLSLQPALSEAGAGDGSVYAPPFPPSSSNTLIFKLADKGNYFLMASRDTDTSGR